MNNYWVLIKGNGSSPDDYSWSVWDDGKLPTMTYLTDEQYKDKFKEPKPTLEEIKETARLLLREKRKEVEYGGFELNGQIWDSAEKDELRLNSVSKIFEAGLPEYSGWKIAEGVYITLTPELLQQVSLALMNHYGKCFATEASKHQALLALTTVEAVEHWIATELSLGW